MSRAERQDNRNTEQDWKNGRTSGNSGGDKKHVSSHNRARRIEDNGKEQARSQSSEGTSEINESGNNTSVKRVVRKDG
jgi:hypothetical protein